MSIIVDENPNEMEQVLATPVENVEEEAQAMPAVSEEGGEDASGGSEGSGGDTGING
jgi:hypothetical protein